MRPPLTDPTAGERARAISAHPGSPSPVTDPTDPGHGEPRREAGNPDIVSWPIADPTDPRCEERVG